MPWMASPRIRSVVVLLSVFVAAPSFADTIRVRLQRLSTPISLSGMGVRYPSAPMNTGLGFRALKIQWRKDGPQITWTIKDRDTNLTVAIVRARTLELSGLSLRLNLKSVPDRLSLVPAGRSVDLVAKMNLEDYLRGVVPSEMPNGWPIEALKAQAVAARTYALHRKSQRADASYDVEADVTDQVFLNPLGLPTAKASSNAEIAVRETRGVVLLDETGRALPTYFHADCGGRTEEARDVWGQGEEQGTAVDSGCPVNPNARWSARFSARELGTKFNKLRLARLDLVDRTASGRIGHLRLRWSDGDENLVSGNEFRMAIGHDRLRSTLFEVVRVGDHFEFRGQGFGHGAGLCQWGAKNLAAGGAFYTEILLHYYPKAVIREPNEALNEVGASTLTSTKKL